MGKRRAQGRLGWLLIGCICACSAGRGAAPGEGPDAGVSGPGGSGGSGGAGGASGSAGFEFAPQPDAGGQFMATHPSQPLCPGAPLNPNAEACESDRDCTAPAQCLFDNSVLPCTLGCAGAIDECGPDTPCSVGLICTGTSAASLIAVCTCGGGTRCTPVCTDDASCGLDARCEPDGQCLPIACDDGASCAAGLLCDPGDPLADAHGCRALRCDEAGAPACAINQTCGTATAAAPTGCRSRPCSRGTDCDCGACSPVVSNEQRVCVARPGQCGNLF